MTVRGLYHPDEDLLQIANENSCTRLAMIFHNLDHQGFEEEVLGVRLNMVPIENV